VRRLINPPCHWQWRLSRWAWPGGLIISADYRDDALALITWEKRAVRERMLDRLLVRRPGLRVVHQCACHRQESSGSIQQLLLVRRRVPGKNRTRGVPC
jgi:hypothetical protein